MSRRILIAAILLSTPLAAQSLTTPEQALGFSIGADYQLADYTQLHKYWEQLASESPRMLLDTIGTTAEGRPQVMAIISAPDNLAHLEEYRQISEQLARGRVDEETARDLAARGKAVIWIDGGLHASEVLGAAQLMELVWQFVSRDDPETTRILNDVIILAVHANPDGMELVSDWYMRNPDPLKRSLSGLPRLYQKYVGHDNNRDLYRNAQPESQNMSRVMFTEWYPQVMYNHHQTGPSGTVMFAPPFRDPFNYVYDPMIPTGLDFVGAAMHRRFTEEDKGGTVSRDAASYSTWWNGGLRTVSYFHNIIGLLTETIGSPTPITIPLRLDRQLPAGGQALPVEPGVWHFRQSIDYSMTANRAVLDLASRYRSSFLYNIWKMGNNSIARGSRDDWTHYPALIADAAKAAEGLRGDSAQAASEAVLHDPARRAPRAYIIPAGQAEMGAAIDFLNAMAISGIEIKQATAPFTAGGKNYQTGSFVIQTDQPFRPHILDMFEPQDHPTDLQYPGGPPKPPYDNAGWTLAMQMGFNFDRELEPITAPLRDITDLSIHPVPAAFNESASAWQLDAGSTDAFRAVNQVLTSGGTAQRMPNGAFVVSGGKARTILATMARERALNTTPVRNTSAKEVKLLRVGLVDNYGGSMAAGWTRWIFEQYDLPFTRVFAPRLDAGNLNKDFDVLVFVGGMIPSSDRFGRRGGMDTTAIPAEYRDEIGRISVENTIPELKDFVEQGGRIVTIGSSTVLANHLDIPLTDHMSVRQSDGTYERLSRDDYYTPGSLHKVKVDNTQPAALGAADSAIVMFANSPVFDLPPDAAARGITPIAWFDTATPLRSGWANGQGYLEGGVTMVTAAVGKGMVYLYGPEVLFRAQPEGTYRFVFNAMYR